MSERARRWIAQARDLMKRCFEPHRRGAFAVLIKASLLIGALSELGWLLDTRYFSRRFEQFPISLAWSMLSMIFLVTVTEVYGSLLLKLRSARLNRLSAEASLRLTAVVARYVSGESGPEEIGLAAKNSRKDLEKCIATALLQLRGSALRRMCELPVVAGLRDKWIAQSRRGDALQRRYAVEQMALLRDPSTIPALEKALQDRVEAVEAAAVRGLLQLPSYQKRDELLLSLAWRSYLVRVLTACESSDDASGLALEHLSMPMPGVPERELHPAVDVRSLLALARAIGSVAELEQEKENAGAARASCLALAAQGAAGVDSLRRMSAAGEAGDAPAEALGALLAAAARGGRT
jgi:hypothetical protein